MNQPELGLKIAELRKAKGITQEELAHNCNINVRTVQRIETGIVAPRSFTLNLIFSYLDYKSEDKTVSDTHWARVYAYFSQIINGNFENTSSHKIVNRFIKYSWIAGLIYFLLGFAVTGLDLLRNKDSLFIAGKIFYIILKIIIAISAFFYLGGFVVIGSKLKNHLLVISSLITIFTLTLFSLYDIASLFYNSIEKQTIDGAESITFGIIEIVFGIGLLRLTTYFGRSASIAGTINIIGGCFYLSLVLWFIGDILTIPSDILEITILYIAFKYPKLLENKPSKEHK